MWSVRYRRTVRAQSEVPIRISASLSASSWAGVCSRRSFAVLPGECPRERVTRGDRRGPGTRLWRLMTHRSLKTASFEACVLRYTTWKSGSAMNLASCS